MAGNPVEKIRAMLASDAPERQIAAAIVLGAIGARDAATCDALARAVDGGIPPVQRHALEALARLASGGTARKLMPRVLAGLASRDEAVRRAAAEAALAFAAGGSADSAVAAVRARLAEATDPTERRGLEEVLGRVGGKDAFAALLTALDTSDAEASRAAALAVRQRLKEASAREKASYLAQVTKLLSAKVPARGKAGPSPALRAGALKNPRLSRGPRRHPDAAHLRARQAAGGGRAGGGDRRAAVHGPRQGRREGPRGARRARGAGRPRAGPRGAVLARHPRAADGAGRAPAQAGGAGRAGARAAGNRAAGPDRRSGGGRRPGGGADRHPDRVRAEAAATALAARPDGAFALGRALPETRDPERAALLARLLRPRARAVAEGGAAGKKLTRALVADAVARIGRGGPGADATLALARDLDRGCRRRRAAGARRQGPEEGPRGGAAVLRMVGHAADATAEDGYALAAAELRAGRRDEALTIVAQLTNRGFDLASALRRDRTLAPEQRYQLGFALVERRHPAGEEVLTNLAASGRSKLATMAKAKLKSAGLV